ncbi:MAG: tRNA dihydrouridine synthase DusB [Clostridia bacterium]|nr:tRNA dihydrouridine synthase DusB [Clostridia bacterium]
MLYHKLKIGDIELENNLILAPMAGITDLAFRKLCKENGAGLVETEMVSSRAIVYNDEKTLKMLNTEGEKRPISMQIFGNDPEIMAESAKFLNDKADIIDINMGCPAPKVVKNGDGSRLLLDLDLVSEIVKSVVSVAKVPVTVKIRKGWDEEHIVALEAARVIEKAGASAIIVHGRTRSQFYSGKADWEIIKKIKESVNIPVIGNGDIIDGKSAREMFETANVDGIMIGRATLGNPWIFKEIIAYLSGVNFVKPTNEDVLNTILLHYNMLIQEKGEYTAVREMRKHVAWYVKGMRNATIIRNQINTYESFADCEKFLKNIF